MDIEGKVFVVTGAGNGIGREVTLGLLARGASVAGLDIREDWLSETSTQAGPHAKLFLPLGIDITNRRSVLALPKKVTKELGPVDGVINVAGIIQPFVRVKDLELEQVDKVMAVNFLGPMNLIKAFLPGLLERDEASLVNVSSMGSYAPVPGQTVYGASKAALNLLSEGLRSELRETNVHVTVVYPGAIGTNIASNSGLDMPEPDPGAPQRTSVSAADAATAIIEAISEEKKRVVIGSDAKTMWWAHRVNPDTAANMIYQGMKDLLN